MTIRLDNEQNMKQALDYFNCFHMGFIKAIKLVSRDYFIEDYGQVCTGAFDVEMEMALYNYLWGGKIPYDQVVKLSLFNISQLSLDFSVLPVPDWYLNEIRIEKTDTQRKFILLATFSYYDQQTATHKQKEISLFHFQNGIISDERKES